MTIPKRAQPALPALTGVRFFAALAVVCYHYIPHITQALPGAVWLYVPYGALGVSLFYVLSGFVLAYNYHSAAISRRSFYAARFARVYPMLLISLAAGAAVPPAARQSAFRTLASFAAGALMIQVYIPSEWLQQLVNGPAWSVSCEAFFYLLFPGVMIFLVKHFRPGSLPKIALAVWLLEIVVFYGSLSLLRLIQPAIPTVRPDWLAYCLSVRSPIVRSGEFVIGVCLGLLFLSRPKPKIRPRLMVWTSLLLLIAIPSGAIAGHRLPMQSLLIFVPVFAVLVYGLASGGSKFLAWPPLVFLGECSYSLYLLHVPVMRVFLKTIGFNGLTAATAFLVSVGLSATAYAFIELPARNRIRRILAQHGAQKRQVQSDPAHRRLAGQMANVP